MPFDNGAAQFAAGSLRAHKAGWNSWVSFHRSLVPNGACVTSSGLRDYATSLQASGKSVFTIEAYLRGVATGYTLIGENDDRLLPLKQYPWWLAIAATRRAAKRTTPIRVGRAAAANHPRDRLLLALTRVGFAPGALSDLSWHTLDAIADPAIKTVAAAWRHVSLSQHRDAKRARLVFPATMGRFTQMSPRAIARIIANLSEPQTTKGR